MVEREGHERVKHALHMNIEPALGVLALDLEVIDDYSRANRTMSREYHGPMNGRLLVARLVNHRALEAQEIDRCRDPVAQSLVKFFRGQNVSSGMIRS